MPVRKTNKRKHNSRRKTSRRIKNTTRRHKRGGSNNVNTNDEFEERRINLINNLQNIIDSIEPRMRAQPLINITLFINEIREFEREADDIDHYFGNNDMEEMLNQRIEDIMAMWGYDMNINNNNNNNNNTLTIISNRRINNNKNNNNDMSVY